MGRGWRAAQRQSEDVTDRVLAAAKQGASTTSRGPRAAALRASALHRCRARGRLARARAARAARRRSRAALTGLAAGRRRVSPSARRASASRFAERAVAIAAAGASDRAANAGSAGRPRPGALRLRRRRGGGGRGRDAARARPTAGSGRRRRAASSCARHERAFRTLNSRSSSRGGRSSVGRAPGCGPGGRGFESPRSPSGKSLLRRGFSYSGDDARVASGHVRGTSSRHDFASLLIAAGVKARRCRPSWATRQSP